MNKSKPASGAVLQSGHDHNNDNAISTKLGHDKRSVTIVSDVRSDNSSEERILPIRSDSRNDGIIRTTEVQITRSTATDNSDNKKAWRSSTSHVAWGNGDMTTKYHVEDRV